MGDLEKATFEELMTQVAAGSQSAVWEIVHRYSSNILRVARRTLPDDLRRKFDSVDIVQSVWKSFLKRDEAFAQFASPAQFVAYVAAMAKNKVYEADRRFRGTGARDIRREVPYGVTAAAAAGSDDDENSFETPDRSTDPPDQVAAAREAWTLLMETGGPRLAAIVEMRMQRRTDEEIAASLGVSPGTIRRDVQKLYSLLDA